MSPHQMPPVTDQSSLESLWITLMGDLGFDSPQLWVAAIVDGRTHFLGEIADVPLHAQGEAGELRCFFSPLLAEPGASLAFLFARPGHLPLTPADRSWVQLLLSYDATWPVHVATDTSLRVVAPDDLVKAG